MEYPFKERIKKITDERDKTLVWLAGEINKTDRWIHGIKSINDLTLATITSISSALDFDFLDDYNKWLLDRNEPPLLLFAEPQAPYKKKEKRISVTLTVSGEHSAVGLHFGKVLDAIKKEGDIYGFDID
jgi:hypothetical protein